MSEMGWKYLTAQDKANILRGVRDGKVYGGPYHVEIYPADRCNIDCFFCSTAAIRGTDELSMQRIEQLIDEMKRAGTRAMRFAGGGEPLFHRKFKDVLRKVIAAGIPVENITTNAVLLDEEMAGLLTQCCDQVTVSLNTFGAESYASMMQTPPRNYDRVLRNVRGLVEAKKQVRSSRPAVNLQFLVWRENFRDIPRMYELSRELGVDTVIFNGLSYLKPDQLMSDAEVAEMMALYEAVVRRDEFRTIRNINTFERDISRQVREMIDRLHSERSAKGLLQRARVFLSRDDFTMREKLAHRMRIRREAKVSRRQSQFEESCVIGWYSMVVRSDGQAAPCCILQGKKLGNIYEQPLAEVWAGPSYQGFRGELSRIIAKHRDWTAGADDRTVDDNCGWRGTDRCPMKSFYYFPDVAFVEKLSALFDEMRG
jgi:MoaA/NifB/PqqE/SkfB family radical SAM enzyme